MISLDTIILFIAALAPAVVLIVYVYKNDKVEKEPAGIIIRLLIFGIIATIPAGYINDFFGSLLSRALPEGSKAYNAVYYFLVVAVAEEGVKYLALALGSWKSKSFNCSFDGVVYAVTVALGFAVFENFLYVFSSDSIAQAAYTAVGRMFTAVPGHACDGVLMGCFYGAAKKYSNMNDKFNANAYRFLAYFVPVLSHGTYDFVASLDSPFVELIFVVFIAILFVICLSVLKSMSKTDTYISGPLNGTNGKVFCANCGTEADVTEPYCPHCGHALILAYATYEDYKAKRHTLVIETKNQNTNGY